MSIEALLDRVAAGLEANTVAIEKLLAGREEALAQLKTAATPTDAPKRGRGRPAAATTEEAAPTAAAGKAANEAAAPARPVDASNEELKVRIGAWLSETNDEKVRGERAANLKSLLDHFGSPAVAGDKSTITDDQRYQATFYIERFKAGLPVDFGADYDFDGDPTTQGAAPTAEADDLLG